MTQHDLNQYAKRVRLARVAWLVSDPGNILMVQSTYNDYMRAVQNYNNVRGVWHGNNQN